LRGISLAAAAIFAAAGLAAAPELVLDPGHGVGDPGVHDATLNEADLALDIAKQVQVQLKAAGMECVLSRDATSDPAPSERVAAANASGASAFLSLHFNHSPSPSVRGPRIFIPKASPNPAKGSPQRWDRAAGAHAEESKALALELAKALSLSESVKIGVQSMNLVVFKGLTMPGVLVELGFLSHAESRARLADPNYRAELSTRLAGAVLAWAKPGASATTSPAVLPDAGQGAKP
jgi:N-acetylmuramoyl-L-alanine amidase